MPNIFPFVISWMDESSFEQFSKGEIGHSNEFQGAAFYIARGQYRRNLTHDFAGAIADYTEAIRLEPNLAEAYAERAVAWSDMEDYTGAIADFTEAIRLAPNNDYHYHCRGSMREQQKDYAGAIADYTEAIRLEPKDHNYGYRADVRLMQGDVEGAIDDLKQAANSDVDNWWGWYLQMGTIYVSIGDTTNAIAAFEQALALNLPFEADRKYIQEYIEKHSLE